MFVSRSQHSIFLQCTERKEKGKKLLFQIFLLLTIERSSCKMTSVLFWSCVKEENKERLLPPVKQTSDICGMFGNLSYWPTHPTPIRLVRLVKVASSHRSYGVVVPSEMAQKSLRTPFTILFLDMGTKSQMTTRRILDIKDYVTSHDFNMTLQ